jgi:two-component system cell cycle sensor histidine kinase/response regulator CckA
VFIPAVIEKKPDEPVYSPSEQQGHGETVLIVDDEGAVRDTTQKLLNQNGYKTLKAVDRVDAVSVYGRNQDQIKVVVTDLKMPNMDGISLVRILRNMNPDLLILVVSGHPDEHDLEVLKPCSSIHLLEKPHKSQDLLHWVHHLLHHKELLG